MLLLCHAYAGTASPKKPVEKIPSRIDQQLGNVFDKFNAIADPLLNFLSPAKTASLPSVQSPEAAALTASQCKEKLLASMAGCVQSFETAKNCASDKLKDKVQEKIDSLVNDMLQCN